VSDCPSTPVWEFPLKMLVHDSQNTGTLNLEEWYTKDLPYTKLDWDINQCLEFGSRDSMFSVRGLPHIQISFVSFFLFFFFW